MTDIMIAAAAAAQSQEGPSFFRMVLEWYAIGAIFLSPASFLYAMYLDKKKDVYGKIDKKTYLRALPDEEIDAYLKENWKDTISDYNDEKIRRIRERQKAKTGRYLGTDGWEIRDEGKDQK